jgi:hypothetical protein
MHAFLGQRYPHEHIGIYRQGSHLRYDHQSFPELLKLGIQGIPIDQQIAHRSHKEHGND